jgi:transposase
MSLHPHPIPSVPEETARVARIACPRGHLYRMRRDELGTLFTDDDFAALFPTRGQPAEAPWRLALVTILHYIEAVAARQAAEAVRGRIDGQSALRLERTAPGFDRTVFSEFRPWLVVGAAAPRRLDAILARQWLQACGRQRPDSTPVRACGRAGHRVAGVGDTRRQTRNRLAVVAPAWLHTHGQVEWGARSGRRVEDDRWPTWQDDRHA